MKLLFFDKILSSSKLDHKMEEATRSGLTGAASSIWVEKQNQASFSLDSSGINRRPRPAFVATFNVARWGWQSLEM